ncbi:MAG: ABC transporter ATP-binding protein [bacterium]|nr:ABC transporter ATP-binding protein [bacterium]
MISIRNLTRNFESLKAVDDLTVTIPSGCIVALLGANGAGKTTTLNMLTTLLSPSDGTAEVEGFDIKTQSAEVRRNIGYVPEHGALYEGLTADEYLELAGRIRGMSGPAIVERSTELMEFFEVADSSQQRLATFSKGMRRKILVTAALLHRPRVLFLDEPMDGLDVRSQKKLGELLQEQATQGCTVVYSSHILQQVEELCEHVVLIHQGKLRFAGPMTDLQASHEGVGLRDIFLELTEDEQL